MTTSILTQSVPSKKQQSLEPAPVSIGSALPPFKATQKETLDFFLNNLTLSNRSKALYKRILNNPSIEKRHFAVTQLKDGLETDLDKINQRFEKKAVELSTQSLKQALAKANLKPTDLDFIVVTTCTGYLCPGLSSYLIESVGLRKNIAYSDLVGVGCGAAVPGLKQARDFVQAHPGSHAAVVSTEVSSAAFYSSDDADVIVSNAVFADGSASLILTSSQPQFMDFESLVVPEWRNTLRFKSENGFLKNVLGKDVPQQAAQALHEITQKVLTRNGLTTNQIDHWVLHSGGEKVLSSIRKELSLSTQQLASSYKILKNCGNMSSPTVLFVLEEEMKSNPIQKNQWTLLGSFGAGFSAHVALFKFS